MTRPCPNGQHSYDTGKGAADFGWTFDLERGVYQRWFVCRDCGERGVG